MIESEFCFSLGVLNHFIDNALNLKYIEKDITGFELINPLLAASSHNTYVETVSDKSDTLYLRIKESDKGPMSHAYLNYISRLSKKIKLKEKRVMLAFDYTDEDFYGNAQGFDIHG